MKSSLDCTIIILSYNSRKVTDTCLEKVDKAKQYCQNVLHNSIEVIVVDNASSDGSADMIRKKHPFVKLIAKEKNVGYAAGNNLAMKQAKTPYIILMNSDAYIHEDTVLKSLQYIHTKKSCDIVTCKYVNPDGSLQPGGGFLPTPLRIILWSFGIESIPVLRYYLPRIYGHNLDFFDKERTTEWYPPCFFLLKRHVYDVTQGFDEQLFFHMVDAEWCHRIHKEKFTIWYTPEIEITHLYGASSKNMQHHLIKDNFKGLVHFCKKHYQRQLPVVLFFLIIGLHMRSFFYRRVGNSVLGDLYQEIASEL